MKEPGKEVDALADTKPLQKLPNSDAGDETQKLRTLSAQEVEQILKRKRPRQPE